MIINIVGGGGNSDHKFLYAFGDECTSVSGGFQASAGGTTYPMGTATKTENGLYLSCATNKQAAFTSQKPVDLTKHKRIGAYVSGRSASGEIWSGLCIAISKAPPSVDEWEKNGASTEYDYHVWTVVNGLNLIDISTISGSGWYVRFLGAVGSDGKLSGTCGLIILI